MFRFEHHIFFYAFLAIPLLVGIFAWYLFSSRRKIKKLGQIELVKALIPDVSLSKKITKLVLFIFGLSSLILALCNLQTGNKMEEVKREGADIIVALDVSNSMLAQDLSPNRLERAKFALEKMIDKLQGDRLGIVVFAGEAYVQLPITTDYSAAKLFLSGINTQMVPTQGTNIGAAIRKSIDGFSQDVEKNKTIVVITDGENHEPEAIEAAEDAEKAGIMINTIGIGSENGVPIPLVSNGVVSGYRKDKDGSTIVTKLNNSLLQEIAGKANGIYVQATNADIGLDAILNKLNELEKKQIDTKMYTDYESQFQWFLGLALLFLFIEFLISERVSNWFRNLFTEMLKAKKAGAILVFSLITLYCNAQNEKQLLYNGNNYYREGRNEMAISNYREALKTKQDFRKANFNLGDAIYKEAMTIKNSKDKRPIMGMKPDSLANIMFDEAAGQFDVVSQTVSDKDTLHRAYHNLGNCRLMQKNYDQAINAYKKALKLDPKDEDTRYNLAYALTKQKEQNKDKQQQQQQQQNQDKQQQQQQQQQPQMSKQEAERMLNALKNTEQKLQGKKKKAEGERVKTEKDW